MGPGDKVISTVFMWGIKANAIVATEAKPAFVDVLYDYNSTTVRGWEGFLGSDATAAKFANVLPPGSEVTEVLSLMMKKRKVTCTCQSLICV